jgi:hypothetical protein
MFKLFSDIYFVVYKLYYVGQNDNLGIRVSLKNWDRGSSTRLRFNCKTTRWKTYMHVTTRALEPTQNLYARARQVDRLDPQPAPAPPPLIN